MLKLNVKKALFALLIVVTIASVFTTWAMVGKVSAKNESYDNLKVFAEVLALVQQNYVEGTKDQELLYGAIKGMLRTLDPHTAFMPPDMYKEIQVETEGSFGGLGIEITIKDNQLTVVSPIEGTPAFRTGIKSGDRIIKVEGKPTGEMSLMEAVKKMRGPKGSKVTITIMRDSFTEPKDFTMERDTIPLISVKAKMLDDGIGYIKLRSFHKTTGEELDAALKDLDQKSFKALILDLRNNPGGLLNQAVEVTEKFLPKGKLIVETKGKIEAQNGQFTANVKKPYLTQPMVVIVNPGTASASEIVSSALQFHRRAIILGTQTFGKGSVQTILPLTDGSALRLTTALYYSPNGKTLQGKGVSPDIVVEEAAVVESKPKPNAVEKGIIREKDLERHLGGEMPAAPEQEPAKKEPSVKQEKGKTESEIESDAQLQRAVDLLKGWEIFKKNLQSFTAKTVAQ